MEEELTLNDQEFWDNYFSDIYEEEIEAFLWEY